MASSPDLVATTSHPSSLSASEIAFNLRDVVTNNAAGIAGQSTKGQTQSG
jgi:hypothetical protein